MKKIFLFYLLATLVVVSSCGSDDDDIAVSPTATGTMQDKEGNEYPWVRIGGLDWMAENLRDGVPFYEQTYESQWGGINNLVDISNMEEAVRLFNTFGNYYTYREALEHCPDGWRLPSDEDWKNLEMELGMSKGDADRLGWRSGAASLMFQTPEQGTGLYLRFGGEIVYYSYRISLYHQYDYGYYWTSTIDENSDEEAVFARMVTPGMNAVNRLSCLTEERWMSVRYVRDAK